MELRHVRYFLAVAQEGNFTRAALRVGIGQSPLSQQIRDLEREVGTALFHRVAHGAELTPAGHAFLHEVSAMPAVAERAVHAAHRAARGEVGALNVGFTASSVFNAGVPRIIRAYRRAYPDVLLTLTELNTIGLVNALQQGTVDVAFLRLRAAESDQLQLYPLFEEPLLAALPEDHPVAQTAEVALADLASKPLLLFPRAVGPVLFDAVIDVFRAAGVEPRMGQTVPQFASILNFVATGIGFSLVPASMAQVGVAGVCYRPIKEAEPVARITLAIKRHESRAVVKNFVARRSM